MKIATVEEAQRRLPELLREAREDTIVGVTQLDRKRECRRDERDSPEWPRE